MWLGTEILPTANILVSAAEPQLSVTCRAEATAAVDPLPSSQRLIDNTRGQVWLPSKEVLEFNSNQKVKSPNQGYGFLLYREGIEAENQLSLVSEKVLWSVDY